MSADRRAKDASGARPILKWAGGKSRSLPHILRELPSRIGTYYEPFMGGAAVFFALAAERRFEKAVLSDRNPALVNVYSAVQKNVEAVIRILGEKERFTYDRETYYRIRAINPEELDPYERAARLIYLNKTGYNGLYRVNSRGQFNVPFGRYKDPRICDAEGLRAAARALRGVRIQNHDFETAAKTAKRGDAVYFDPPYVPVSKTASFAAYHESDFGDAGHRRLATEFSRLARHGVTVVLSNSDTKLTRDLFAKFSPRSIPVTRPINSKASARGTISEILVAHRPSR